MNENDEFPKGFSVFKAHESQRRLSRKLITEDGVPRKINHVAGVDVAYSGKRAVGAVAGLGLSFSKSAGIPDGNLRSEVSIRTYIAFLQRNSSVDGLH